MRRRMQMAVCWLRLSLLFLALSPNSVAGSSSSSEFDFTGMQSLRNSGPSDIFNPTKTETFNHIGFHNKQDSALAGLKGRLGAFGDFDSDLYTDLFWISEDSSTLQVIRWNPKEVGFEMPPLASVTIPLDAASNVVNVAPCDFNRDGRLDVIVAVQPQGAESVALFLYFGDTQQLSARPLILPPGFGGQPSVVEGNGDLWPDLFGEAEVDGRAAAPMRRGGGRTGHNSEGPAGARDVEQGPRVQRAFWLNKMRVLEEHCWNGEQDAGEQGVDCGGSCLKCACFRTGAGRREAEGEAGRGREAGEGAGECGFELHAVMEGRGRLAKKAHAFADMDGDGLSDLVLSTAAGTVEVWLNMGGDGVVPSFKVPAPDRLVLTLPSGAGSVTPADVNRDGRLDLLYAVAGACTGAQDPAGGGGVAPCGTSEVWVAYTHSLASRDPGYCTEGAVVAIGVGKRAKPTEREGERLVGTAGFQGLSLYGPGEVVGGGGGLSEGWRLREELGMDPLLLRAGDLDLDGYVDVMVPVRNEGVSQIAVLWNVGSSGGGGRALKVKEGCGGTCTVEALAGIAGAYAAGVVDFGERGALDLVVLYADLEGGLRGAALWSNLRDGNLFLKARGLNGVCLEWCPGPEKFPDPKPYGTNTPGVSFQYTMLDLSGQRLTMQAAQLAQSSMAALGSPSIIFGLGDAYYYIEELYMGVTAVREEEPGGEGEGHCRSWKGLIPNSQIVASPTGGAAGAQWYLAVLVHASNGVLLVIVVLAVTLAVLSVSIWLLKRREKFLDAMEKQLTAHAFL